MERKPQTLDNHVRWDPIVHFVTIPVFVAMAVRSGIVLFNSFSADGVWDLVFKICLVVLALKVRLYPITVQTRVIRLEERLRAERLVAEPLRSRISELTEGQLIGLRFASDAEVPALVAKIVGTSLTAKDIKKEVKSWRPDYLRV